MNRTNRFWGSVEPPQNRAEVFNLAVPRPSDDGQKATIRIYGPIDSWGGCWGVSAEEVAAALDSLPDTVTELQVRVNSPGGESWEGLAILNMLRAHPARVVAVVDGIAASAASFIAAGVDETVMSPGTQMMIHDAWGLSIGNPGDMRKAASFLDSVSDSIADLYAEAAGGYRAKWRSLMGEETWFTAREAVAAGLADSVGVVPDDGLTVTAGATPPVEGDLMPGEGDEAAAQAARVAMAEFDLSIFTYAGRDAAPEPDLSAKDSAPETPDPLAGVGDMDEESAEESAETAADEPSAAVSAEESADDEAMTAMASAIEHARAFAFIG